MTRRAQRKFLDRVDPAVRASLEKNLERGFQPPTVTSFTMTGASSLYGDGGTHYEPSGADPSVGTLPPIPAVTVGSFERLTRAMANTKSRRQALKMFGAAAAGAVGVAVLKPFGAATAASCPDGGQLCGQYCCPKRTTCSDPSSRCCCPAGATPCGPSCCGRGVTCVDASRGLCGCATGTTPCGTGRNLTCCPAGHACPGVNATSCPPPNSAAVFCIAANTLPV
ncbi:MAG: hypothetical protein JO148_02945 [Acidimicrobiia bacterium]|nr:hypothetical protein [Acidimicrobiia bacterium]